MSTSEEFDHHSSIFALVASLSLRYSPKTARPPTTRPGCAWSPSPKKGYNSAVEWEQRVTVNPSVRNGKPCIKGTRITVYDVLEYLAGGMSEDEILSDFPDLTREDIRAALAFAAARERRLANSVA